MNRVVLPGCRTEPLGGYLQGLGVWGALVRTGEAGTRAHWAGGELVLTTRLDLDGVVDRLATGFCPLPVVSPWNAGSGFAANGKSVAAERGLAEVSASTDPRLARLRAAVDGGWKVVATARERGWTSEKSTEFWQKARKADVVALCRNELPDDALDWLDAAVVLGQDADPTFSRLLGTGGNFGRQDLSATYVQHALTVLADRPRERSASRAWLQAALTGDESVPYLRGSVGQFDPGRAGGIQSSPWEKQDDKGFVNPWSFLLSLEGSLMFAPAVVRREGAQMSRAALPFMVRASPVGYGTSASDETVMAEVWTPDWNRPASHGEIAALLGEGRASWRGSTARTGLDFVRAIATLGVDRGLAGFTRHVIAERLGQNPLAVPLGRVRVPAAASGPIGLLEALDDWLAKVRRAKGSSAVASFVRRVDAAQYETATGSTPRLLQILVEVGRLHEAVARSSRVRDEVPPLRLDRTDEWFACLVHEAPDMAELRVAAALASGADRFSPGKRDQSPTATLRHLLSPVEFVGRRGRWVDRPPQVPWSGGVVAALAEVHRRRALPGLVPDPVDDAASGVEPPAMRGTLTAFASGRRVAVDDLLDFATGRLDEVLLGDLLRGLILFDWAGARGHDPGVPSNRLLPPVLSLLLPFYAVRPLDVRLAADAASATVTLRPGASWVPLLRAGRIAEVIEDATRRLRAAGVRHVIAGRPGGVDGDHLAACLLLRTTDATRIRALGRTAVLPASKQSVNDREGELV